VFGNFVATAAAVLQKYQLSNSLGLQVMFLMFLSTVFSLPAAVQWTKIDVLM
jgi:hypothetical protein